MVKLNILIALIILAVVSAEIPSFNPFSNYNADDEDKLKYLDRDHIEKLGGDVGPDHGATYLFFDGFYYGIKIYKNVTHRNECLAFIPDVHDDIVDIYCKFKNVTHDTDWIELTRFTLKKIDHILQRIDDTRDDCKIYKKDLQKANRKVCQYLNNQKDYFKKMADHILHNLGIITQKYENYKESINRKKWCKAGYNMGDLLHFLVLWDYPPKSQIAITSSDTILDKVNLRNP